MEKGRGRGTGARPHGSRGLVPSSAAPLLGVSGRFGSSQCFGLGVCWQGGSLLIPSWSHSADQGLSDKPSPKVISTYSVIFG